jgi:uncharacterized protein
MKRSPLIQQELFLSFNDDMQKKFGCRVYKVCVDAPFTCPNRDGTKSQYGCIFCDASGSSSRTNTLMTPIKEQMHNNIFSRQSLYKAKKFIVYFQSFSNTYGDIKKLKSVYDEALFFHDDIIGMSISTRADCINPEKLELIQSYKEHFPYINIEYGMQTCNDKTLKLLNRHETHQDFIQACSMTKQAGITTTSHVILGLPQETRDDILKTADTLAKLKVDGVKIHMLVAMENTILSQWYNNNKWSPLTYLDFISLSCDFIERLHDSCVIHRIGGNGHPLHIVSPMWVHTMKKKITSDIKKELLKRKTYQGIFCRY